MSTSRRTLLAAGVTGSLALAAGCLDFALGNAPLEVAAERAAPTDSALETAGYEERAIEQRSIEERVDVGVERDVEATIWTSTYTKEIEFRGTASEGCAFAAISVPDVSVAGRSFNPIGELEHGGVSIENLTHRESFGLDILADGRPVDVFEGTTTFEGERIDVDLAVTSFAHEGDRLVLVSSHPAALAAESATVEELMESVEHPV